MSYNECPVEGKKAHEEWANGTAGPTFVGSDKPKKPERGQMYHDQQTNHFYVYDGITWVEIRKIY
jgi:hypothetical protein